MNVCSVCRKEVAPRQKCCDGGTILAYMNAGIHGVGGLSEKKPNNNLTDESAMVIRQMMSMVLGTEFFREKKSSVFANDVVIADASTGRKFSFTLTAQEI